MKKQKDQIITKRGPGVGDEVVTYKRSKASFRPQVKKEEPVPQPAVKGEPDADAGDVYYDPEVGGLVRAPMRTYDPDNAFIVGFDPAAPGADSTPQLTRTDRSWDRTTDRVSRMQALGRDLASNTSAIAVQRMPGAQSRVRDAESFVAPIYQHTIRRETLEDLPRAMHSNDGAMTFYMDSEEIRRNRKRVSVLNTRVEHMNPEQITVEREVRSMSYVIHHLTRLDKITVISSGPVMGALLEAAKEKYAQEHVTVEDRFISRTECCYALVNGRFEGRNRSVDLKLISLPSGFRFVADVIGRGFYNNLVLFNEDATAIANMVQYTKENVAERATAVGTLLYNLL